MNKDDNKKTHIIVTGKGGGGSGTTDWNDITNKPDFATVATSGSYTDLNDKPTILTQWFGTQAEYDAIVEKDPNVIYNIEGSDNVQADWNQTDTTADDYIKNKPTIPAAQVNADWNANSGVAQILNKPTLATVATTGSYNDLSNKPTIPAAPVQSNWNESDSTSLAYIQNKPTIPTVPPMATETLTFTLEGGVKKTIEFYTAPNYFYVEDVSGSDNTLSITKSNSSAPDIEVFCSTDRSNWMSMGTTSTTAITATIPANGKLYLKATTNNWATESQKSNNIKVSGNHNVGGNIMSLLYGDNFEGQTTLPSGVYTFHHLFDRNTTLVNAQDLILPATTLNAYCYSDMFSECTSLTTEPVLPATTLAERCYNGMFWGCTALTTPPELPATTLVERCYSNMFTSCTSLTTAPALPATTMAWGCYAGMFQSCSALTTAPALPATTLIEMCYTWMFADSGVNTVITYAQDISASACLKNWLGGVAATGDFYNLGGATYTSGDSGIPTGWTEHTTL